MTTSEERSLKRSNRAPTLKDVALKANVSVQTISRVINNKSDVSPETRHKVLQAVQELGYQPNSVARSLVTRHSLAIGLVLPDISQPFYPEIARGVEDGAQAAGYSVFLCNAAGSAERELQALDRLRGHQVAGQIICNSRLEDTVLAEAITGTTPVVLINRDLPEVGGTVIWTGYRGGSEMAVNHLIETGKRRIGCLGIVPGNKAHDDKRRGYEEALSHAGIEIENHRFTSNAGTLHGGYKAMEDLLQIAPDTDAVFAFNDHMAVGALRFAATHGIRVPEDVAIVGFGGAEIAEMTTPSITTVAVPLYEIGAMAIRELLQQISSGEDHSHTLHAQPQLMIRSSTKGQEP